MRHLYVLTFLVLLCVGCEWSIVSDPVDVAANPKDDPPFLAVWRATDGYVAQSSAPYLRIAVWDDGRIVFAEDSTVWNHNLRQGSLASDEVSRLKDALAATGVFELEGYCYLVPDAPWDCIMLRVGEKEQMLYWDEVELPNYGINIRPKKRHLDFMSTWKAVNRLALS